MRPYVSIDIETTGLDPDTCQTIQVGAVIDDWETPIDELPTFNCYVNHGIFKGEPYTLSMHAAIFRLIAEAKIHHRQMYGDARIALPEQVAHHFKVWLEKNGIHMQPGVKILVAGKNFGAFDKGFLDRLPGWKRTIRMKHRFIDPGNMFYIPGEDDGPPDTKECLRRAGLPPHVNHTAPEDAMDVVRLIRYVRDSHG